MAGLMDQFAAAAEGWTRAIVAHANPTVPFDEIPTRNWPMVRLDHALIAAAAYLALCVYGIFGESAHRAQVRAKEAADKLAGKEAPLKKREQVSVMALLSNFPHYFGKVAESPAKLLLVVHNVVQVFVSAYMALTVYRRAMAKGYGLVCNEYDPQELEVSSIVWVFYVSKVRCAGGARAGARAGA
jgi:hypothetical protein